MVKVHRYSDPREEGDISSFARGEFAGENPLADAVNDGTLHERVISRHRPTNELRRLMAVNSEPSPDDWYVID